MKKFVKGKTSPTTKMIFFSLLPDGRTVSKFQASKQVLKTLISFFLFSTTLLYQLGQDFQYSLRAYVSSLFRINFLIQKWARINYRNRGKANRKNELSFFSKGVTFRVELFSLTCRPLLLIKKRSGFKTLHLQPGIIFPDSCRL